MFLQLQNAGIQSYVLCNRCDLYSAHQYNYSITTYIYTSSTAILNTDRTWIDVTNQLIWNVEISFTDRKALYNPLIKVMDLSFSGKGSLKSGIVLTVAKSTDTKYQSKQESYGHTLGFMTAYTYEGRIYSNERICGVVCNKDLTDVEIRGKFVFVCK